jgi:RNA polymerase sporulation-specific sigma factor
MSVESPALVVASVPVKRGSHARAARRQALGSDQRDRRSPLVAPPAGKGARRRRAVGEELLLRRAQLGDRNAERSLIERHEPLARQICRGFFLANGDSADLLQAARIGLWQAIHCWDPERGTRFRHFAVLVMRREVMMLVSASRARNQGLLNSACSLQAECARNGDTPGLSLAEVLAAPARDACDPAEVTLWRERLELILAALPELSEHERGSLSMTLNGLGQPQIGAELGTGAKSINNALQRARRKLRAAS